MLCSRLLRRRATGSLCTARTHRHEGRRTALLPAAQTTGVTPSCAAAPAVDELPPALGVLMPRIRSIIITSASLRAPEALTRRDLRRCAFLRLRRRSLRSSLMSRERARRVEISPASWSAGPAEASSLPGRLLESLEAGCSSAPELRLFPSSRLGFGGASPAGRPSFQLALWP